MQWGTWLGLTSRPTRSSPGRCGDARCQAAHVPSSRRTRPVHALYRNHAPGRLTSNARRDPRRSPVGAWASPSFIWDPLNTLIGPGTGPACPARAWARRLSASACHGQPGRAAATCTITAARGSLCSRRLRSRGVRWGARWFLAGVPPGGSGRCRHGLDDECVQVVPGQVLEPGGAEQAAGSLPGPRLCAPPGEQGGQEQG